jgi:peroxin-7
MLRIWDVRQPRWTLSILAHQVEVFSADWCKVDGYVLATASADHTIKIWDVRMPQHELTTLIGHNHEVRRVIFSPFSENMLASWGCDLTVRLWDFAAPGNNGQLSMLGHHDEFAMGLDFSPWMEGLMACSGRDEVAYMWGTD